MALYRISFTVNGIQHHTTGESTYPTKEIVENGKLNYELAMENALMFIGGYMDVMKLEGNVSRSSVHYTIHFE